MYLEPFTSLSWAYQLHYYLCIGTYRHRPTLAASGSRMSDLIAEICARHDYHPLKLKSYPDHVRLLVSLRPNQTISKALQTIKSNASREYCLTADVEPPLSAKGYLARSVGRVRIQAVKRYLDEQSAHRNMRRDDNGAAEGFSESRMNPGWTFTHPQTPVFGSRVWTN